MNSLRSKREKKPAFVYVNGAIAVDVIYKRMVIGLLEFNYKVIAGNVDRLSCQVCSL